MSNKVQDKINWLRDNAPRSVSCDAEGVWCDYKYNRITERQAVIKLNKWIKTAQRNQTFVSFGLSAEEYSR